jgi:hypothetical protein
LVADVVDDEAAAGRQESRLARGIAKKALDGMRTGRKTSCAWITAPNAVGRPILRCFKLDFFGEALQISEKIFEISGWPSRVAGHSILEGASAAIESDELANGAHRSTINSY